MLETSRDVFYLVLSLAIAAVAFFFCWIAYYFAMTIKQVFSAVREMRQRLSKLDDLIKSLKEKIEHSTSYLLLIGEGIKKLVDVLRDKSASGRKKNPEKQ